MSENSNKLMIGKVAYYYYPQRIGFIEASNGVFPFIAKFAHPDIGQLVAFRKAQNKSFFDKEAIDVRPIWRHFDEIRPRFDEFDYLDSRYITNSHHDIFYEFVDKYVKRNCKAMLDFRERLEDYVISTDINKLIESYEVKLIESGSNRPGKDDSASIFFGGEMKHLKWSMSAEFRFDIYIKDLFPQRFRTVFRDRAFTSWRKMIAEYKEDQKNWEKLELECQEIERNTKDEIRKEYNQEKHFQAVSESIERMYKDERDDTIRQLKDIDLRIPEIPLIKDALKTEGPEDERVLPKDVDIN